MEWEEIQRKSIEGTFDGPAYETRIEANKPIGGQMKWIEAEKRHVFRKDKDYNKYK